MYLFFSDNPEKDYETKLTVRRFRGEQLSPDEARRLAESDKRFERDFYRGFAIAVAVILLIFTPIIYQQFRQMVGG